MKKTLLLITIILLTVIASASASNSSDLIPPYHWTYHSLKVLSDKDLVNEKVIPGQSVYTKEQVAVIIITAMDKIRKDPSLMEENQLCSMRQLMNGYKKELEFKGNNFIKMRTELENLAIATNLKAMENPNGSNLKERPLSFEAVKSVNKFTFDIYRHLAAKNNDSLFISPYSISSALSMTYAGASGKTALEMEHLLFLNPDIHRSMAALIDDINTVPSDTALTKTANALWPAKDELLLESYSDKVKKYYGASLTKLDYKNKTEEARTTINRWVGRKTEGKIENMIGQGILNKDTSLVLTNAAYFKSEWMSKFEPQNSRATSFNISPSESVQTIMMTKTDKEIKYLKESDFEIAEIPYKNNRFSMLIILPNKGLELASIESKLDYLKFSAWTVFMSPQKVRLTIPKFKTEQNFELGDALTKMGMGSAFNPNEADFSGMNGKKNLHIGAVIHKTFLEVGEEGTEAAAATAVIITKTSLGPQEDYFVEFKADRPFIYLIRDNLTGAIIFIGRYTKP